MSQLPIVNSRIDCIDAIRGFTMILVVYSHLTILAINPQTEISKINEIFILFRMPLFFFISGFFVFKQNYTYNLIWHRTRNRLVRQLYPTLIAFLFCIMLFFDFKFIEGILKCDKKGYWFTLTAVELFFFVIPLLMVIAKQPHKKLSRYNCIVLSYGIVGEIILWTILHYSSITVNSIFGLGYLFIYFPFFIAGMLFKINYKILINVIKKEWTMGLSLLLFICCLKIKNLPYISFLLAFFAIIFFFSLFHLLWENKRVNSSSISKVLRYIGTMTLEIYLLHYFIIYPIRLYNGGKFIENFLNSPYEIPTVLVLCLIVISISLGLVWIIKRLHIYNYIFPNIKKRAELSSENTLKLMDVQVN